MNLNELIDIISLGKNVMALPPAHNNLFRDFLKVVSLFSCLK